MSDELRRRLAEELQPEREGAPPPGQRRVQVDLDDLAGIVRRAVDDAQLAQSGGRGALEWEVQVRLARTLERFERAQRLRARIEQQRHEIGEELSRVRAALVARRGFVDGLERSSAWPVDPERWHILRLRLQARLLGVLPTQSPGTPSARVVAADLLELFAKERAASLADFSRRSDVEVARLERRLTQLLATLEETEDVLASVRELSNAETGYSSGYRDVQGLEAEERFRELKAAMLADIFQANVELQRAQPAEGSQALLR